MGKQKRRKHKGLSSEFLHELGRFRLENKSKDELIGLIVKANKRRKEESAKWQWWAKTWHDQFIQQRDAQARTCNNFRKYMDDMEARERAMTEHEAFYKQWKDHVYELAAREAQRLANVEHLKQCDKCEGRIWRKRFLATNRGMQKYVTQMLKFVNDVLRTTSIPDIEKARMVDMRNSLIDSRDMLAKMAEDKSNLPDEWADDLKTE